MTIYRYFQEHAQGHSRTNAYLLALASLYIYRTEPPARYGGTFATAFRNLMRELSADEPFTIRTYLRNSSGDNDFPFDTQAAVLSNTRVIIVVFRGSESPLTTVRDWLTNFHSGALARSTPASWGPVHVHRGFYGALATRHADIRTRVRALLAVPNPPRVFLTGHSLGGGLATLCAYRFRKLDGIPVHGVYTYGGVKVGTHTFQIMYNTLMTGDPASLYQRSFRWVRGNDFASRLPRAGSPVPLPGTAYRHIGRLNFIQRDGTVQMNRAELGPLPSGATSATADHSMPGYCMFLHSRLGTGLRSSPTRPSGMVQMDCPPLGIA